MPITVNEKEQSPTLGPDTATREFIVAGTDDVIAAQAALLSAVTPFFRAIPLSGLPLVKRLCAGFWEGTAQYGVQTQGQDGDNTFSFETGSGTQHITQSLATVNKYAAPGRVVPDPQGAIGVTKDGVDGCDIVVPQYGWTEEVTMRPELVTSAYRKKLLALTGKVCNAPFRDCGAGEALFLGASGSKRWHENWKLTFKFAGSPNVDGVTIGDIGGIAKGGFEYLWVKYEDYPDLFAYQLVKRPVAVFVERVYEFANYADLGIGTAPP